MAFFWARKILKHKLVYVLFKFFIVLGKIYDMSKNTVTTLSYWALQFLRSLCIIAIGFMIYDGVRHTLDPDFYFVRWEWYGLSGDMDFVEKGEYPAQTNFSYYFNWVQISLQIALLFKVWSNLLMVLNSLNSLETFISENSQRFKTTAYLLMGLFGLNLFHFYDSPDWVSASLKWQMDFSILFFALGAFVMAEVFSEGKRLADEQKLFV